MINNKYRFDVIIIGAGISGIICGCYLAKAGLKVLIVEKNLKAGGYCTSFNRNGFLFDSCVHSLGSCRDDGILKVILDDLELSEKIKLNRYSPSDIIITQDCLLNFYSDLNQTIKGFQDTFPKERNSINRFFNFINLSDSASLLSLRRKTFKEILDSYFYDNKLKAILSFPVLGNAGLPSSLISGFTATMLYKEFMIDGGYYPNNKIQSLPDSLIQRFQEFGGELLLSKTVKKIKVKNSKACGVGFENGEFISSRHVVSACDSMQTFTQFLNENEIGFDLRKQLFKMRPSLSMFILYLGFDDKVKCKFPAYSNVWYLPTYNIDNLYKGALVRDSHNLVEFMIRFLSEKKSATVYVISDFKNEKFWQNSKDKISTELIRNVENAIPGLSQHIVFKSIATPYTLKKWTLNYKGANYGWSSIPSQLMHTCFLRIRSIKNFYMCGHWSTFGHGLRGALYSGVISANSILKNMKNVNVLLRTKLN